MERTSVFFFLFTSTTSTFTNKYDRLWPRKIYCILMGKRRQMPMFTSTKVATRHYSILNLCVSGWRFPCEFEHFNNSAKIQTPTMALFVYDTFYDTIYNAIRVLRHFKFCLHHFLKNQCFQVTCSVRGMGFRGVTKNVILRKQIGMSRSFSLFHPHPPHPTTRRCSRAICFLNSSYLF